MSDQLNPLLKSLKGTHHCTTCVHRNQRFNFDFNVEEIKGGCLDCVNQESNFIKMSEKQMHGIK